MCSSGVASGTYNVTVKNAAGCISPATQLTVGPQPTAPVAPTATVTSQPTCTVATGTITVTAPAPAAGITYSIDGLTYTNTTGVFTGVVPGTYNVTVKNATGCTSSATQVTVDPQPAAVIPTVSVVASSTSICAGGSITFTAIPVNGGANPTYQWQINGANVAGQTAATFITSTLASGDIVTVIMSSNDPCANPATANSNPVTIVNSTVAAAVSIAASTTTTCPGGSVTFTATPTNGGTNPTYQWQINGVDVTGQAGATFTSTTLNNNDVVTVIMTSNDPCATPAIANSNPVTIASVVLAAPTVAVTQPTCTVATATITVSAPVGAGSTYSINGSDYQASPVFNNVAAGPAYNVTVQNASGCISAAAQVAVSPQPPTIVPTVTIAEAVSSICAVVVP